MASSQAEITVGILARVSELSVVKKEITRLRFLSKDILVVVDSKPELNGSLDSDLKRLKELRVFYKELKGNYSRQRNFIFQKARFDWILFLDPDEKINSEFIQEVVEKLENNSGLLNGYFFRRNEVFLGKKLSFGEGRVWHLRLGNRKFGEWDGDVHERWNLRGPTGYLDTRVDHYGYEGGLPIFFEKNIGYARIRSKELANFRKTSLLLLLFKPVFKFMQNYLTRMGFLDGTPGLIHAFGMAYYSFLTEALLFEGCVKLGSK